MDVTSDNYTTLLYYVHCMNLDTTVYHLLVLIIESNVNDKKGPKFKTWVQEIKWNKEERRRQGVRYTAGCKIDFLSSPYS